MGTKERQTLARHEMKSRPNSVVRHGEVLKEDNERQEKVV